MSEENVENLRVFLETWGREPWTPEAWERGEVMDMSFFDPDVIYEDQNLPDHVGEAYHGRDGVLRAAARWPTPGPSEMARSFTSSRFSTSSKRLEPRASRSN
jgi:hypothetical protein